MVTFIIGRGSIGAIGRGSWWAVFTIGRGLWWAVVTIGGCWWILVTAGGGGGKPSLLLVGGAGADGSSSLLVGVVMGQYFTLPGLFHMESMEWRVEADGFHGLSRWIPYHSMEFPDGFHTV